MAESPAQPDPGSGSVTEVVLRFDGSDEGIFDVAQSTGCGFELEQVVPCPDGSVLEYLRTGSPDAARLVDRLLGEPSVSDARVVDRGTLTTRIELHTSGGVVGSLVDDGVLFARISGTALKTTLTAYVPQPVDVVRAMNSFRSRYPDAELVAKRQTALDGPRWTWHWVVESLLDGLTDRQVQVLRLAFEYGYYQVPREHTGEELAEMLGISPATFSSHIRAAEANLFAGLLGPGPAEE